MKSLDILEENCHLPYIGCMSVQIDVAFELRRVIKKFYFCFECFIIIFDDFASFFINEKVKKIKHKIEILINSPNPWKV